MPWIVGLVIKLHPGSPEHVICVVVNPCDAEIVLKDINRSEENTIVFFVKTSFLFVLFGPIVTFVVPWPCVPFNAPGVSDLN